MNIANALVPLSPRLKQLLPGLLAVAVAAELFTWFGVGTVSRRIASDALGLTTQIADDDAPLRRWLHQLNADASPANAPRESEARDFLKRIDVIAARTGVRITRLQPHANQPAALDIGLSAGFGDFLQFAAETERLRGVLRDLQIAPAPLGTIADGTIAGGTNAGGTTRLDVGFTLELPPHSAGNGTQAQAAPMEPGLRDPFAPPLAPAISGIDLSERYHLTGITQLGDTAMATIDGRDYREGDLLDGMIVSAVGATNVQLLAGSRHGTLHFKMH